MLTASTDVFNVMQRAVTSNSFAFFRTMRPIAWAVLYLAVVECALEYRAHRRGWDTLVFGAVRSDHGASATADGSAPTYGPTQDFPFRSRLVHPTKRPAALRIWIASASHAEDLYLPPDSIFPSLLGERLRARGVPAEILNASKAGTAIDGNVAFLRMAFDTWEPDLVILYQLSMEIAGLSRRFLAPGAATTHGRKTAAEARAPAVQEEPSWAARLFEESTAYTLLNANVTTRLAAAQLLHDDIGEPATEAFRQTLHEFIDTVRSLGAEPTLCTFATSASPTSPESIPDDVVLFVHRWNEHLSARGWLAAVHQFNAVIREVATAEHVPLIDAATVLTGHPEFFRDPVHFSREGHRKMADVMASTLSSHTFTR